MEENNRTTINASSDTVTQSVELIRKLIAALQEDSELRQSLEKIIEKFTDAPGKSGTSDKSEPSDAPEADNKHFPLADTVSDIFSNGEIASLMIGFVAGAAVVGGGVLLHKVLSR